MIIDYSQMGEKSSKRLSFLATNHAHRLSDGLHTLAPSFPFRESQMTEPSQNYAGVLSYDHPNSLQLIDRTSSMNRQYQRTLTTTIVTMNDDEFQVTTPTKRPRGNSVLEESLLNAGNYIRRKFSYGSSD